MKKLQLTILIAIITLASMNDSMAEKIAPKTSTLAQQALHYDLSTPTGSYFVSVETAYYFGLDEFNSKGSISFDFVGGYQLHDYFIAGAVVGMRSYNKQRIRSLPLMAHLRVNLTRSSTTPYFALNIGHSISLIKSNTKTNSRTSRERAVQGLIVEPSVGIKLYNGMTLSVGYSLQKAHEIYFYDGNYKSEASMNLSAVTIKYGFVF